jgi:hypothetical protein
MRSPVRLTVALSLFAMALLLAESIAGVGEGLVMLAPALMLALPLLVDRYLGEKLIERVRAAVAPPRPRRRGVAVRLPRAIACLVPRGGALLASALATRPPPVRV